MKIIADERIPLVQEYFGALGELSLKPGRAITRTDVQDADMLLVRTVTPVNKELLEHTQVKFVGSVTAGADHLDTVWLDKEKIIWRTAHGFNAPPVADYVVSVIAALQRRRLLTAPKCKAAVIGVGSVGRLVVERLRLLGFDVVLCDPLRERAEKDFISIPLDEIADVDLISVHVPLTREGLHPTYHFIEADFLRRQKPGCVLLNAGRGAVIDSLALMQDGTHLTWCFDVWEDEPDIDKDIMQHALIATPHIAGYSVQSKMRGTEMIYRAACDALQLQPNAKLAELPRQQLSFAGNRHHWQDIVLGIFNPLILTAMMRTKLLSTEKVAHEFDEMRHQFNYRYEFAYTKIVGVDLSNDDIRILARMGVEVC